jgi:hypothetical protein
MKKGLFAAAAFALLALPNVQPASAYYYGPWCAYERAGKGVISSRCDLRSYEACRAAIAGTPGTWCTENPHFRPVEKPLRKAVKPYRYQ